MERDPPGPTAGIAGLISILMLITESAVPRLTAEHATRCLRAAFLSGDELAQRPVLKIAAPNTESKKIAN